ncbi:MAG: GNAT family N-acetyltransferase [bacterium]
MLKVRPLKREDARQIGLLTQAIFVELGHSPVYSPEATERLFSIDWLKNGAGLVLEKVQKIIGYGWTRFVPWHNQDIIHIGLFLAPEARKKEYYQPLTDELLHIAKQLSEKFHTSDAMVFYRCFDNIHPPILHDLGFRDHPISMLGFRHNLRSLPEYQPLKGINIRPIDLTTERQKLVNLAKEAFDDPANQGEAANISFFDLESGNPNFKPEQFLFAEAEDKPVGYMLLCQSKDGGKLSYDIAEFGVLPRWRRKGIARTLMVYVLNWIKNQKATSALAASFSSNPSIAIYWHLGFRPDPIRTYCFYVKSI